MRCRFTKIKRLFFQPPCTHAHTHTYPYTKEVHNKSKAKDKAQVKSTFRLSIAAVVAPPLLLRAKWQPARVHYYIYVFVCLHVCV